MEDIKKYIEILFIQNRIDFSLKGYAVFNEFVSKDSNVNLVKIIKESQDKLMLNWRMKTRILDILNQAVSLPNGTVGKGYEAKLDFSKLGWSDLIYFEIGGLDDAGLAYDVAEKLISGIPQTSGDLKVRLLFKIAGEAEDAALHEKDITLVINPDPKSLWKDIESNVNDPYWKEDNFTASGHFAGKNIAVVSKRGRSHANVGTFRDDDFTFESLNYGWSVLAISDGAGSAVYSRKGSKLACNFVVSYFAEAFTEELSKDFDVILAQYYEKADEESSKKVSHFVYNNLSQASWYVHKQLEEFAMKAEKPLKDFHSTLVFTLVKKYSFGYAVLTFGVGDCPIALLDKDLTKVHLMNWLDVGEFGGGTRFITMPEIFKSDKFSTRFSFKLIDDFSYLFLMTDGVYDPKFIVESNLEKIDKWKAFLEDLNGGNDDGAIVNLDADNPDICAQLSNWMDFWSPGNHDDRTLAIIY